MQFLETLVVPSLILSFCSFLAHFPQEEVIFFTIIGLKSSPCIHFFKFLA